MITINIKDNKISQDIKKAIDILWDKAYTYGPTMEHWTGNEYIATADIVLKIKDHEIANVIEILQDIQHNINKDGEKNDQS